MIKRELGIFLIVGTLTVLLDFGVYRSLVWFQVTGIDMAKTIGFLSGTVFAYFANRFWTFRCHSPAVGTAWRFILVYATTLGINVLINSFALKFFNSIVLAVQLAFLLATGVSAMLNFMGMKFFVFKKTSNPGGI